MIFATVLILTTTATAQQSRGLSFSGIFESSVSGNVGAGDAKPLSYGVEEYANIRMQSKVGDRATFYGAVNLIAAAGDYALAMLADTGAGTVAGKNYAAAIELERLHFKIKGDAVDIDGGLMRFPFGYGQVWRPSDFLNPPNPLKPDARPRAVVGGSVSWYPVDELKILGFAAAGSDPLAADHGIAGISADKHWSKGSVQLLYAAERSDGVSYRNSGNPVSANENITEPASSPWTQRIGASVKADLELGFLIDALYTYNRGIKKKIDGLSASAGFDYSLAGGNLIVLAEYLYSGAAASTSLAGGGDFTNENYLYTGGTWRFSDFTNTGLALITSIDDVSFIPVITFSQEIFQGATFTAMAQIPLDRDLLQGSGKRGEFGPIPPGLASDMNIGSYFYVETKLKLRF